MLKRLFVINNQENHSWINIVLWWEFRRILYNFLLIIFGIFSLILLSLIVKDLWSFFSPPIVFYVWIVFFLLLANIFYTSGWIFQLITRRTSNKFITCLQPKLFIYGLIFSFCVILTPTIFAGIYTIVTGERIKSQYSDFSTTEPKFSDIVGEYELSELSIKKIHFPDSLIHKTVFRFNADSTFVFQYFPDHGIAMHLTNYDIVNACGKWKIEKKSENWAIDMDFDFSKSIKTGDIDSSGFYNSNGFIINKNKPPYEIYIMVGDPDSWEGITLQKQ